MKKIFIISLIILIIVFIVYTYYTITKSNQKLDTSLKTTIIEKVINNNVYVIKASYSDNGINLTIHFEENNPSLILEGKDSIYEYTLDKESDNTYTKTIDLNNLKNDNYFFIIKGTSNYYLINNLDLLDQIIRSKIKDKLVTFNYDKNIMSFKVEDFSYNYDILIDPGHGGIDIGASNETITESELNLKISLYEKERYEEMGLKVLLSREDNSDGMMMGDSINWNRAKLRGYAIGYNGVSAKLIYSNHHNASEYISDSGFEIIVSNSLKDISLEKKILSEIKTLYPDNLMTSKYQLYGRDIDSGIVYNRINNEAYSYIDYYATIRIPDQLFNVKTVTYEGAYMSNKDNFKWYYEESNWKKISEIKIKYYVEYLGKTYIPRN